MSARTNIIIFMALAAFILVSSAIFFVEEREKVILLRLGQIERADYEPGIHFKVPVSYTHLTLPTIYSV